MRTKQRCRKASATLPNQKARFGTSLGNLAETLWHCFSPVNQPVKLRRTWEVHGK